MRQSQIISHSSQTVSPGHSYDSLHLVGGLVLTLRFIMSSAIFAGFFVGSFS